jgi:cardiolipin synthase (CMP-forming)
MRESGPTWSYGRLEPRSARMPRELRRWALEMTSRLPFLPAAVTWVRILGVPAVLLLSYRFREPVLLFWVILTCALSDYFDGWLARRIHRSSYPGKVLDFVADKLFLSVVLFSLSINAGLLDTLSASLLAGYHLLLLLALSAISWSISIPIVTITTGERLAVLFSYLLVTVAAGTSAFPGKHIFHSLLWPVTIIAVLSAITGLLSYLRLLRRFIARVVME